MMRFFRSAKRGNAILPRSITEADIREIAPGAILPMEQPGFFARLFGRR